MRSFKAEVRTGSDPKYYSNAVRFKTKNEADRYGTDLAFRWTAVADLRIVPSDEDVNYKLINDELVRLERAS